MGGLQGHGTLGQYMVVQSIWVTSGWVYLEQGGCCLDACLCFYITRRRCMINRRVSSSEIGIVMKDDVFAYVSVSHAPPRTCSLEFKMASTSSMSSS